MIKISKNSFEIYLFKNIWKQNKNIIQNEFSKINSTYNDKDFTKIIFTDLYLEISMDHIGSCPLFYCKKNSKYHISDNANYLYEKYERFRFNRKAYDEIYSLKHTIGNKTLSKDIKIILSGEKVLFSQTRIKKKRTILFKKTNKKEDEIDDLKLKLKSIFNDVFDDLVDHLDKKKQIVIPLSGGYDSRLLACLIRKRLPNKKIIAYTYGNSINSGEVLMSQKVAKKLNFRWYFVHFNKNNINSTISDRKFKSFLEYSMNLSYAPHCQEYFAIEYLINKNIISKKDTVIPGHSLDLVTGSRLTDKKLFDSRKKAVDYFFSLNAIRKYNKETKNSLNLEYKKLQEKKFELSETFDYLERQPKFILNILRTYEFFDLYWRIPFWDTRIVKFFNSIDNKYREEQYLFKLVSKEIFYEFDLDMTRGENLSKTTAIKWVKKNLPPNLRFQISKIVRFNLNNLLNLEKLSGIELSRKKNLIDSFYEDKKTSSVHGFFLDIALNEMNKKR